jgi:hypothetical protein
VEESNRSDIDAHADCCVCGKEVLIFNDFDREVTVTGWDPEGATKLLRIVTAALGYTIPEKGKTVLLIIHQSIFNPTLNHKFLSIMKMRLHDVVVKETPKCQCFKPTELSHSISVRGDMWRTFWLLPWNCMVLCHDYQNPSRHKRNLIPVTGMN